MEKKLLLALTIFVLVGKVAPFPAGNLTKRATTDKNINDVFSRFVKGSKGWASYYGIYPVGTGACSLDPMPAVFTQKNWIKVAAGEPDFQSGLGCGTCLKIEASGKPVAKGNKALKGTYYAVIVDLCGACGQGDLDFYMKEVFDGKWEIAFDAVDCPDVSGPKGNIQYRFSGANPWYLKLQITNSKLPTAAVEVFKDGKWHCTTRASDNHFTLNGLGEMKFPLRARLTSIAGETVGGDIPKLENDKDQDSGFQYKSFKSVAGKSPPKLPCHGQGGLKRPGKPDETDSQGQEPGGGAGGSNDATADDTKDKAKEGGADESKPDDASKEGSQQEPDQQGGDKQEGGKEDGQQEGGKGDGQPESGKEDGQESGSDNSGGAEDKLVGGAKEDELDFCKDKESGIYANPNDCTTYFQCANKRTFKKNCAPGLHFNAKIKNCDYPKNAGCSKEGSSKYKQKEGEKQADSKVNWCQNEKLLDGRHAHPNDCSKFINCSNGEIKYHHCPHGHHYDGRRKACYKAGFVDCQGRPTFDAASHATSNSSSTLQDATQATLANPDKLSNETGLTGLQNGSQTGSVGKLEDNGGGSEFCKGRSDGHYAIKSFCNAFYKCTKDVTQIKTCPTGLKFNQDETVCDWPQHAKPISVRETSTQSNAPPLLSRFMKSSIAKISYYGNYPAGTSSCLLDPIPPILSPRKWILAAVSKKDFIGSMICGTCMKISLIDLTRDGDPEVIYAAIVDSCNACEEGEINLYIEGKVKRKANVQAIECLASKEQNETLKAVSRETRDGIKIQIRNTLLPVVSLEMFSGGKWICLPRDEENNFIVLNGEPRSDAIQLRATSVAGETVGFLINKSTLNQEVVIPNQFRSIQAVRQHDKQPNIACNEHINQSDMKTTIQYRIANDKMSAKDTATDVVNKKTKASFYKTEVENMFVLRNYSYNLKYSNASTDRIFNKVCPSILKFNAKQGSCDWPSNVNCGKDIPTSLSTDTIDEEVYTKKFI
eukprot:gene3439-3934_t